MDTEVYGKIYKASKGAHIEVCQRTYTVMREGQLLHRRRNYVVEQEMAKQLESLIRGIFSGGCNAVKYSKECVILARSVYYQESTKQWPCWKKNNKLAYKIWSFFWL